MLPEQRGLLSSLFSRFRRDASSNRKRPLRPARYGRRSAVEELETRRLLVSRVFIDFGDNLPIPNNGAFAGVPHLATDAAGLLNAVGVGGAVGGGATFQQQLGVTGVDFAGGTHLVGL